MVRFIEILEIKQDTAQELYKTIALPTSTYASEAWVMTRKERGKIQSAEMQFLRNALNLSLIHI